MNAANSDAESRSHASHGAEKSSPPIGFDRGEGIYHSEDNAVFQDGKRIATCFTGHQGQAPDIIAARIATLLNKDFTQFCIDVAAYSQPNGETE